ncbi:MAG: ATP-binding cassette domain-containing protein [Rhodospirillales bacterium]|nr:ATP-binding cassette domain-containing protein [Rhodospirillales bacterium]
MRPRRLHIANERRGVRRPPTHSCSTSQVRGLLRVSSLPSPDPAITLEGVGLRLGSAAGEVNILRGIDLSVRSGETVGLVGPSGSGKTSLLMIIAGLERPTSGRVIVAGQDFAGLDEDRLAAFRGRRLGVVFQNFHLIATMTARENVALPLDLAGEAGGLARADGLLATVGLGQRLTHYPAQLSGGEQQRVALARAFVTEPALLLADEPTGNLDGATGAAVIDLMFDLHRRRKTTLLLITHDPALAGRCGRAIELRDGRIVGDRRTSPLGAVARR